MNKMINHYIIINIKIIIYLHIQEKKHLFPFKIKPKIFLNNYLLFNKIIYNLNISILPINYNKFNHKLIINQDLKHYILN